MKLALVSTIPVFPTVEGNRRRILNLARAISSLGHSVHFVFLPSRYAPGLDMAAHQAEFGADHLTVLARSPLSSAAYYAHRVAMRAGRKLRRALGRRDAYHFGLDEIYQTFYSRQLTALQLRHGFEAVMVEYIFNSLAFSAFPKSVLRILDTHDSFADRHLAVAGAVTERDYWFSVSGQTECRAFRRADIVLAIQEEEARSFARRLGEVPPRTATVSHLVDDARRLDSYEAVGGTFVGSSNGPNIVSIRHFLAQTLPLIVAEVSAFRLHVVGSIGNEIPDHPHVVKHGRVAELTDVYRLAPLSLNPMEVGTGINIKLLDAMSAAVGTVSTATGSRGLGPEFSDGVVVAPDQDPRAFADAVIALSKSEQERAALGARAYDSAQAWNAHQLQNLRAVLDAGAAASPRTSPAGFAAAH